MKKLTCLTFLFLLTVTLSISQIQFSSPNEIHDDVPTGKVFAFDIENDGDNDIILQSNSLIFLFENTDGLGNIILFDTIANDTSQLSMTIRFCNIMDVDFDGDKDIVYITSTTENGEKHIYWHENYNNNLIFSNRQSLVSMPDNYTFLFKPELIDIDNDGDSDLIGCCNNPNNELIWFENIDGNGTFFQVQSLFSIPHYINSGFNDINFNDFDNDLDTDILITFNTVVLIYPNLTIVDSTIWYENDGNGVFNNKHYIESYHGGSVASGDFDNDNDIDLITTNEYEENIYLLENITGNGNFSQPEKIFSGYANKISAYDIDCNNYKDIFFGSGILINDSNMNFTTQEILPSSSLGSYTYSDLDNDGDLDLIYCLDPWAIPGNYKLYWYENIETFFFNQPDYINTCPNSNTIIDIDITNYYNLQWQVDTGSGFNDITNNTIYAGANSEVLEILSPSLGFNNYLYRCRIEYFCKTEYTDTIELFVGSDLIAPDYSNLADINDECGAIINVPTALNCSDSSIITATTSDSLYYNNQGSYLINWLFVNSSGDSLMLSQNINIDDHTAPVPDSSLADIIADCSYSFSSFPTATDNCSGTITATTTDSTSFNYQGFYSVTWNFDDGNGNTFTHTQQIEIQDYTTPMIVCPPPAIRYIQLPNTAYQVTGNELDPSVWDNCGIDHLINDFNMQSTLANELIPPGDHSIYWQVWDINHAHYQCHSYVSVQYSSGIKDSIDTANLSISPNPFSNQLYINSEQKIDALKIYNSRSVLLFEVKNPSYKMTVKTSDLESGIYILQLNINNKIYKKKIVKI